MDKIDKNFDGLSWKWEGRKFIKNLKPICPKLECQSELDINIELNPPNIHTNKDGIVPSWGVRR